MPPRAETYRGESGGPNVEPPIVLSRGALGGVSTCWPPYVTTGKYLRVWPPREAQPRLWCPVFTGLQHILSAGLTVSFRPSWRSGLIPLEVGTDNCVPRGTHCKSHWCTVWWANSPGKQRLSGRLLHRPRGHLPGVDLWLHTPQLCVNFKSPSLRKENHRPSSSLG